VNTNPVIARSEATEAIQTESQTLDCFASLAMTINIGTNFDLEGA